MNHLAEVPLWAAIPIAVFLVIGAGLALLGAVGLLMLDSFYDRIHAPTLASSWGTGGVVMASMLLFSVLGSRPVVHEFLIGVFVTITTPVTLMLLVRAGLFRDRVEGNSPLAPRVEAAMEDPERLHREGQTIIMVTHEPDIAARAGRLVTLHDGRIAADERQGATAALAT